MGQTSRSITSGRLVRDECLVNKDLGILARPTNSDFVQHAESFGTKSYRIDATDQLLLVLRESLASNTVSLITCPVDYSENTKLTTALADWRNGAH
jgi:thiamine pyrophosphate-dependent acetolactate synthase large subunit-like protein